MHALGDYLLSCSQDQHWAFSDIRTGQTLVRVTDDAIGSGMLHYFTINGATVLSINVSDFTNMYYVFGLDCGPKVKNTSWAY